MDVHQDITNDPAILNMTPQRSLIKSVTKLFAVGVAGSSMMTGEVARPPAFNLHNLDFCHWMLSINSN